MTTLKPVPVTKPLPPVFRVVPVTGKPVPVPVVFKKSLKPFSWSK